MQPTWRRNIPIIDFDPTWIDNVGFMSGAIDWAKKNMSHNTTLKGVTPTLDIFEITRRSNPKDGNGEVVVLVRYDDGRRAIIYEHEIQVFDDAIRNRARDMVEKYQLYFNNGEKTWVRVGQMLWKDSRPDPISHFDYCPADMAEWFKDIKSVLETRLMQIYFFDCFERGLNDLFPWKKLMMAIPHGEGYPELPTTEHQQGLLRELKKEWSTREGQAATPVKASTWIFRMAEWVWTINQSLPLTHRYDWASWTAILRQAIESYQGEGFVLLKFKLKYITDRPYSDFISPDFPK